MLNSRRFQNSDADRCSEVIRSALKSNPLNLNPNDPIFKEYTLEKLIEKSKEINLFVFFPTEERIMATGGFKNDGEIKTIYIHPDFQGKGYGREIMKILENQAREKEIKKLFLYAFPGKSSNFYEKCGYTLDTSLAETYIFKNI